MTTKDYCVTVHSCRLNIDILVRKNLLPNERYRAMDEYSQEFRLMPIKCACRKMVTLSEANDLIETGQAEQVFKVKRGTIETDHLAVWMSQERQVPRVDLISAADIDRAYVHDIQSSIDYIEEVHAMYMENRAKLIVPFREDPTEGRLLFPFPNEGRTSGGYKKES